MRVKGSNLGSEVVNDNLGMNLGLILESGLLTNSVATWPPAGGGTPVCTSVAPSLPANGILAQQTCNKLYFKHRLWVLSSLNRTINKTVIN